jgi:hypothetical protein
VLGEIENLGAVGWHRAGRISLMDAARHKLESYMGSYGRAAGSVCSLRQEMELMDVRSIEVSRAPLQRLLGLGTVIIASAASA